jgi:hypothetical protein
LHGDIDDIGDIANFATFANDYFQPVLFLCHLYSQLVSFLGNSVSGLYLFSALTP